MRSNYLSKRTRSPENKLLSKDYTVENQTKFLFKKDKKFVKIVHLKERFPHQLTLTGVRLKSRDY